LGGDLFTVVVASLLYNISIAYLLFSWLQGQAKF